MRLRRVSAVLLVAAGAVALSAAKAVPDRDAGAPERWRWAPTACSWTEPDVIRLRSPGHVAFIATGVADTVFAGPGSWAYRTEGGHAGPGKDRSIYGQIAQVRRFERSAAQPFQEAMARGDRSVVLVPWDFAADCSPVPWNRSAQWLWPGTGGAFVAFLRKPEHWAGGRPTFDVMPATAIQTPASPYARSRRPRRTDITADEFLTLYELLPDRESLIAAPDSAMSPLVRWAQANRGPASRLPIIPLLNMMRWEARMGRYHRTPSPIAGTYRIVYRVVSGDSSVLFARTHRYPMSHHLSERVARTDTAGFDDRRPIGHDLFTEVAPTLAELTPRSGWIIDQSVPHATVLVIDSAVSVLDPPRMLPGSIDLDSPAIVFAPDSGTRAALQEAFAARSAVRRGLWDRKQPGALGRFTVGHDGVLRYDEAVEHKGVPVLTIRAERISTEHYDTTRRP